MKYYNANGIPTDVATADGFWMAENHHEFTMKEGDLTPDLETIAISLRSNLQRKLFGSVNDFYKQLPHFPIWVSQAGMDSDLSVSKMELAPYIQHADELTCRAMYYNDVSALIGSLQNAFHEVKYLMGEFYKELNIHSFMLIEQPLQPDMEMHASGLIVTKLFSYVNHLFISLYSQLDYTTKVCYELEHLQTDFSKYNKLQSAGILIGDAKRISFKNAPGSLFEDAINLRLIQSLRNEIIHDSSFENIPKVFQLFKDNVLIEKYIILPDHTNGFIDSIKGRKRFFSSGIKLNEILPDLVTDFWKRMLVTLQLLQKSIG